jgi:hypothetical protein
MSAPKSVVLANLINAIWLVDVANGEAVDDDLQIFLDEARMRLEKALDRAVELYLTAGEEPPGGAA